VSIRRTSPVFSWIVHLSGRRSARLSSPPRSSQFSPGWRGDGPRFGLPHIEALLEPVDYLRELKGFEAEDRRWILESNARELTELRPT